MNSGASTWPTKMLAAVDSPTAPPTPMVRLSATGEALHDRRQDAPVEQQRGEHAHHQHDRQRAERQHEVRCRGIFRFERQRRRRRYSRTRTRCRRGSPRRWRRSRGWPSRSRLRTGGTLRTTARARMSSVEADDDRSRRHRPAVLADRPGKGDDRDDARARIAIA